MTIRTKDEESTNNVQEVPVLTTIVTVSSTLHSDCSNLTRPLSMDQGPYREWIHPGKRHLFNGRLAWWWQKRYRRVVQSSRESRM
jgi:hypothetical protein